MKTSVDIINESGYPLQIYLEDLIKRNTKDLVCDLPPQYVPVLMLVQPTGFEKVGPGLIQELVNDTPVHYAV